MYNRTLAASILAGCLIASCSQIKAQNIQIHYDTGSALYGAHKDRPLITTTVEMFKPDRWGSTFFFVDMDYRSQGIAAAYWEIARELKFRQGNVSMHIEYNGGAPYVKNAFLLGATYTYGNAGFTKGFTFTPMYKYIQTLHSPHQFQLTATWYMYFVSRRFSFTGFADWWREPSANGDFVFLAEPQGWIHLNRFRGIDPHFNLSLGSEVEASYDFAGKNGFFLIPTLAARWDF
ncbi:MAG: DUF5020 family protein [Tannerella sp.]|jgi:hypothetical protein|nr:DUF5020 family protein [Tannerella sp.]